MSSTTLRSAANVVTNDDEAPETLPADQVSVSSGVYRVASRRGYDVRNVLASLRVNIEFVRCSLHGESSQVVAAALADIRKAADRLDHIVTELG